MKKFFNAGVFLCLALLGLFGNIRNVEGDGQLFDILSGAVNSMVESGAGFFEGMVNASGSIQNASEVATLSDPLKESFGSALNSTKWSDSDVKEFLEFIKTWKPSHPSSATVKPTQEITNITEIVEYQVESDSEVLQS